MIIVVSSFELEHQSAVNVNVSASAISNSILGYFENEIQYINIYFETAALCKNG